jgi:hypothetical protein
MMNNRHGGSECLIQQQQQYLTAITIKAKFITLPVLWTNVAIIE